MRLPKIERDRTMIDHPIEDTEEETISVADLQDRLASGTPTVVLDVRPTSERDDWYIPGSIHVDAYDALKREDANALAGVDAPDDELIVIVCGAGATSLTAARQLRSRGKYAKSLDAGMKGWSLAFNTATVAPAQTPAAIVQVRRTGKGCLSYLVGVGGEAAVIDAAMPPEVYVQAAAERDWHITHVLDTHIHADHLSRSRPLAAMTGATFHLPEQQRVTFPYAAVRDGDVLSIGGARLHAFRTPGHTEESTSYLLDGSALFTGDTLFTDGVGRPDLDASIDEAHARAEALYESLRRLLRDVPREAVVLPGHTSRPAPFDGKVIGDTMEVVRSRVDALSRSKEDFVRHLLGRIPPTPPNYEQIVRLNEIGAPPPTETLELEAGGNRCAIS